MRKKIRNKRREQGQATLMLAIMVMTFLLFFSFVVNTGLLINAKINLQNAADLAAYAGAATQARQLDQISYLNYEMRRQYKKFLFRYYFLGNMAQQSHPNKTLGNTKARDWFPKSNDFTYGVPAVCMIFDPKNNHCQMHQLKKITGITNAPGGLDPINAALNNVLKQLEVTRQDDCRKVGITNATVLFYWLYNTNYIFDEQPPPSNEANVVFETIKGLVDRSLGLYIKETLLLMRIKTLESYVNYPAQKNIDIEKAKALNNADAGGDVASGERPIQAFFSAYNTLGEYIFKNDSIELTELLPGNGDGANLLKLEEVRKDLDTFFIFFYPENINNPAKNCDAEPVPYPVKDIPLGVAKTPDLLTYYAIRLSANTLLPFSPFGSIKLTAYSAAQPFGSRIGPSARNIAQGDMDFFSNPNGKLGSNFDEGIAYNLPNLPIKKTSNDAPDLGWNQVDVLTSFDELIKTIVGGGAWDPNQPNNNSNDPAQNTLSSAELENVYLAAMAPTPSEYARYNVINNLGAAENDKLHNSSGDPFNDFFPENTHLYSFWAPIISPAKAGGDPTEEITTILEQQFQKLRNTNNALEGAAVMSDDQLKSLIDGVIDYVQKLRTPDSKTNACTGTDDGECFNVVSIRDPLSKMDGKPIEIPNPGGDDSIFMSKPEEIRSSWNIPSHFHDRGGRLGYSVKIVSFDTLMHPGKGGVYTTGPDSSSPEIWTNVPAMDPEGEEHIQFLKH